MSAVRWIGVTFGGWTAGFVLAILFIVAIESVGVPETQSPLAVGMGVGVGFAQARLLARFLNGRSRWVLATVVGLAAPFLLLDVAQMVALPLPFYLPALVAVGGVSVSVLQWRLLRKVASRASVWLITSPAGWILGGCTVWASDRWLPRIPGLFGALLYVGIILGGGIFLGCCTLVAAVAMDAPVDR